MADWFKKFFTNNAWVIMFAIVSGIWFGGSQFTTYTSRIDRNTDALEKISVALVTINDVIRRVDKLEAAKITEGQYWQELVQIIKNNTAAVHTLEGRAVLSTAETADLERRVGKLEERLQ